MAESSTLLDKLNGLVARFEEVSTLITDPSVIADQQRYVRLTKEYKELEELMSARREYADLLGNLAESKHLLMTEDDAEMKEMAREEVAACERRIPELEESIKLLLVPKDPEDSKNAILEISGGTGGDEAALFAGDLFRMYAKYCEAKGWKLEVSSASEGAVGGFKEVVCSVTGADVYGTLKYESGVHRVQRVPATETQGRVHTSAATVAVLPEAEAFDVVINEAKSSGTPSVLPERADKTSTRSSPACVYATIGRTPIRAKWRKSSSNVPKHATNPRTKSGLWRACAPSFTTKSIRNTSMTSRHAAKPSCLPATAPRKSEHITIRKGESPTIALTTPYIISQLSWMATYKTASTI